MKKIIFVKLFYLSENIINNIDILYIVDIRRLG